MEAIVRIQRAEKLAVRGGDAGVSRGGEPAVPCLQDARLWTAVVRDERSRGRICRAVIDDDDFKITVTSERARSRPPRQDTVRG